ncbi:YraN family protein [Parapedobacter sp. 10938]|uniref:YraN family protein n=1 Tax=Parapedobacter flavus TaxID=3110225 RepID=UPI002DBEB971|nr:YraN family protein [Parapedobacter sp. 10938]MEC3880720.1 YraN family protein [Parapedobacter sp. 10938]
MNTLQRGKQGEDAAVRLLQQQGYRIRHQNWRYKNLEVDIIADEGGILVFVEVKTRASHAYGMPYEFVDYAKQAKLTRAANQYIAAAKYGGEIRFDVVSILYSEKNKTYNMRLIRDAFWPD